MQTLELSYKRQNNHDASLTSKALITSAHVGANPTKTVLYALEFVLSSLAASSDEQYKSKFRKERRRSNRGCFK
jgi:hypothetical protein